MYAILEKGSELRIMPVNEMQSLLNQGWKVIYTGTYEAAVNTLNTRKKSKTYYLLIKDDKFSVVDSVDKMQNLISNGYKLIKSSADYNGLLNEGRKLTENTTSKPFDTNKTGININQGLNDSLDNKQPETIKKPETTPQIITEYALIKKGNDYKIVSNVDYRKYYLRQGYIVVLWSQNISELEKELTKRKNEMKELDKGFNLITDLGKPTDTQGLTGGVKTPQIITEYALIKKGNDYKIVSNVDYQKYLWQGYIAVSWSQNISDLEKELTKRKNEMKPLDKGIDLITDLGKPTDTQGLTGGVKTGAGSTPILDDTTIKKPSDEESKPEESKPVIPFPTGKPVFPNDNIPEPISIVSQDSQLPVSDTKTQDISKFNLSEIFDKYFIYIIIIAAIILIVKK